MLVFKGLHILVLAVPLGPASLLPHRRELPCTVRPAANGLQYACMLLINPMNSLLSRPASWRRKQNSPPLAPTAFQPSAAADHVNSNACIELEGGALSTSRASKPQQVSGTSDPTGIHSQQQRDMGAAVARAQVRPSGAPVAVRPPPPPARRCPCSRCCRLACHKPPHLFSNARG